MKYLLCSDYDGTLCQDGKIDRDTLMAINEFRNKGNLFAVVSGRTFQRGYMKLKSSKEFAFDYFINSNGAFACDHKGNIVFSKTIDGSVLYGKSGRSTSLFERCLSLTESFCVVSEETKEWSFHRDKFDGDDEYNSVSDVEKIKKISSIHVVAETEHKAIDACDILKKEFGEYINSSRNINYIDITPAGVDKATGIQNLIEAIGIDQECVWSIGDNYNDLPMIEQYHGCAIKSGVSDLKHVAEHICDTVGEAIRLIMK